MKTRSLRCCLVVLIAVSFTAAADAQPLSEVLNFDFETGDFTDWGFVTSTGAVVADNGPSVAGTSAGSITTAGIFGGFEQFIAKSVPIESGELLDLSFDYKSDVGATGNFRVQLRYWDGVGANGFSDGGGGTFLGEHTVTLDTTSGAWLTNSLTDLPNPDLTATHVDIRFIANAFGIFDGTALIDNLIVLGENLAGDFDVDGDVDGNDFLVWQSGFGSSYDASHLTVWESNFGTVAPAAVVSAVPEPTTLTLVLFTLAGFASLSRRVEKKAMR